MRNVKQREPPPPRLIVFSFACERCGLEIERTIPVRVGLCYACRQGQAWRSALDRKIDALGSWTVDRCEPDVVSELVNAGIDSDTE